MKIKYLRLKKNQKKKYKIEYFKTQEGKYIKDKLNITFLCSLGCIIFSIYNGFNAVNDKNIIDIIYSIIIFVSGIIFLFLIRKVYLKKINEYVVKKK